MRIFSWKKFCLFANAYYLCGVFHLERAVKGTKKTDTNQETEVI